MRKLLILLLFLTLLQGCWIIFDPYYGYYGGHYYYGSHRIGPPPMPPPIHPYYR